MAFFSYIFQILDMTDNETEMLATHLGHDPKTHKDNYRLAHSTRELSAVSWSCRLLKPPYNDWYTLALIIAMYLLKKWKPHFVFHCISPNVYYINKTQWNTTHIHTRQDCPTTGQVTDAKEGCNLWYHQRIYRSLLIAVRMMKVVHTLWCF